MAPIGIYAEDSACILETFTTCQGKFANRKKLLIILQNLTLAKVTRSGLMLYLSQPNIVPSLPNAHITLKTKQNKNR
jgi:hypothetical protein